MDDTAAEMSVSRARDQLADVVNRAVYAGEATYLTRRGKRLAVVISVADLARERQQAVAGTCRRIWEGMAGSETEPGILRLVLDSAIEAAEDAADLAVITTTDRSTEGDRKS
jgi:prevent-host-death family protein